MKKIILSIFALWAVTFSSNAQTFEWVKQIEGNNVDQIMSVSSNGSNIYSTGSYDGITDFDPGVGTDILSTVGGHDIFVQKLDQNGNLLWVKTIGGLGNDVARIINDYGTSIIISGTFTETVDFDPGTGVLSKTSNGESDVFILALDDNGDFLWVTTIGSSASELIGGQELNSSNEIIVTGGFGYNMTVDVSGTPVTVLSVGMSDVFFLKMNLLTGSINWFNTIGGTGPDAGSGLAIKSNNNILITGKYRNIMDIDPSANDFSLSSNGGNSVFLAEYDGLGNFVNGFSFDSPSDMEAYDIALDDNENIYLTGYFKTTVDFDLKAGVTDIASNGDQDCYVVKLTSIKSLIWARTFGGAGLDQSFGIEVVANGDVYTVGRYSDVVDFDPGVGIANETGNGSSWDIFIHKLNSSGDFQLVHTFGDGGSDLARGLEIGASGDMYVSGIFGGTIDFDPGAGTIDLTATGSADAFLIKYSDLVVGLNDVQEKSVIKLYPNPAQNKLFIELEKGQVLEINILDISGKEIRSITNYNVNSINVSDLKQGVYFLKVTTENSISTNRFIKQ
ncbi:MAG: hypothetical protein ACI93P_001435 [bacterium]|jgi:hypothetical protein